MALASRAMALHPGAGRAADIPLDAIAAVERAPGAAGLRLGVLGTPNLVIRLRTPLWIHGPFGIRKTAETLLLQVDDPDRLASALGVASQARGPPRRCGTAGATPLLQGCFRLRGNSQQVRSRKAACGGSG